MPQTTLRQMTVFKRSGTLALVGLLGAGLLAGCGATSPARSHQNAQVGVVAADLPSDNVLPIVSSYASSANDSDHWSQKAWDGSLGTWWSANGIGQWAQFDLGQSRSLDAVSLAWYRGDVRRATFDVELSQDGQNWSRVLTRVSSSGSTKALERYNLSDQSARYVRIINEGNTENTAIGLTEIAVNASSGGTVTTSGSGHKYYVDCWSGSDSNSGTSTDHAWRSLSKANNAPLAPGDGLFLRRGCRWTGPLNANWSGTASAPITIGAYGSGNRPMIYGGAPEVVAIRGHYQIIDGLETSADKPAPYKYAVRCTSTPNGWTIGFDFMNGASHNTLQNSKGSGMTGAVHLAGGSTYNKVLHNTLVNNTVMSSNTLDPNLDNSGAWGVLVNGDHNEVAYNYFSGNTACSEKYGVEGATLEVYKGSDNYMHHNTSIDDTTFTELGGSTTERAERNVYAYNLYAPVHTGGELLVLRGWDSTWGANVGTKFYGNTAYLVSTGIACFEGCNSTILSAHNNIVVSRDDAKKAALWADGPFDEGNNIYWKSGGAPSVTIVNGKISGSSKIADPHFVNPGGLDFHLASGSPAVNAGVEWPLQNLGITSDLDGQRTPYGPAPDAGAFERQY